MLTGCGGDSPDVAEQSDTAEDGTGEDAGPDDPEAGGDADPGEGADSEGGAESGGGVGTVSVDGQSYTLAEVSECELSDGDIQLTAHNDDRSVVVSVAVFSDVPSLNGVDVDVPELDYLDQPKEWTTFGFGEGTDFDYTVEGSTFTTTVQVGRVHGAEDTEAVDSEATIEITC